MPVPMRHILAHGPVLRALATGALGSAWPRTRGALPATPGAWLEAELPARPQALVDDFVRFAGGDPARHAGTLPPALFPQWSFALAARTMRGLPYPMARVLNAGCRIERRAALPAGEPLKVRARLESIDDDGKRALLTQKVVTGTASAPDALACEIRAFVPLARREGGKGAPPMVSRTARELSFVKLAPDAGLDFAKLTGDFNPIHWVRPAARAAGFRSCILHGFATLAIAVGAVERAGAAVRTVDVRFTRPLPLPAGAGVYREGERLWVGDGPGGLAYLEGTVETAS